MRESDRLPGTSDPLAWVDRYGNSLFRYALSRLRDAGAAEDAVQETFVAALAKREQFAGTGSEAAWLMGILKRKIVDQIRARGRLCAADQDADRDLSDMLFDEAGNWRAAPRRFGPQPGAALERTELWQALRECLSTLPLRQADVFTLRELEGLDSDEICRTLEISSSNLWVLLYRARLQLSTCMKSRGQLAEAN